MWEVFLNGKSLAIVETNFAWANAYWGGKNRAEKRYTLRPLAAGASVSLPYLRRWGR